MICEDCSFFIDEICTDLEGYVHKETGVSMCRYNPNAILREDAVELLPELLMALKGLFVSTNALLLGLHNALGISPDDDDFPVAMKAAIEQARIAIAMAENRKV